ncbi:MAG: phytanoyl-CoA dioxygenase family protein [Gammaproteobacteria bacterium TMED50]|nr:MAG: phytanoyl-CoA dioxygenase family protein [Gammaproteobacteria bacterium TMED50]
MSHQLSAEQIDTYQRDGFLSPLPVFTQDEVRQLRKQFEDFEQRFGGVERAVSRRTDLHLLTGWGYDVVTDARIVEPVTSLLGPDVLLWSMNWFIKEPDNTKFVSFHQDANYWGLEPHDVATAWIALSDAGARTGPMEFIPGSHRGELYEQHNTFEKDNLLSRGQTIEAALPTEDCFMTPLAAGEMSLHHVRTIHRSGPNTSSDRRIGMVLRYCATHVRQTKGADTATLVAGEDQFGHFRLMQRPNVEYGEDEMAIHADAVANQGKMIMRD